MKGLGKIYPPDSVVFQDIWLSFLYGAKIGVIGANGAGKSTLLKIMAGLEHEFQGEATLSSGFTVGFLPQEPLLNPSKNVLGNVEEGVAPVRALLTRFDEINAKFAEELSPGQMEKVLEEQARVQDAVVGAGRPLAGWSTGRWSRRCASLSPFRTGSRKGCRCLRLACLGLPQHAHRHPRPEPAQVRPGQLRCHLDGRTGRIHHRAHPLHPRRVHLLGIRQQHHAYGVSRPGSRSGFGN